MEAMQGLKRKHSLGQFFTPHSAAEFMASLFGNLHHDDVRLLDAGAGAGALSAA